ncbi:hypothetical protein SLNWT_3801 [Streptomyces albus]|uniref:Uncharacterized protein n=1 Tax=Streptomyces albus (strain ATCC 21838 / DSM 41398 / FERM P-419 / JCM 4703 / NBRC 107858) TaxID=1081613 RepID=A0A0B5F1G5_STRA4|nr:hypothetical protein SLNWT_3801 [Streptomyces albus]AOU78483.1 hypothetical protein SLNHY_3792 [Streptomyces albus]AYN34229.1 hypothetical protein DUI70_3728 [Streptomyces albus]
MEHIVTVQDAVTAFAPWMEPTEAELDVIEQEAPLVAAELDLLDAQIITLDRIPNELDARRVRRAHRKVLAVRTELANKAAVTETGGAA